MERTVWRRIVHPLSIQQTKHIKYIQRKMLQIIPYFLHVVVNISISAYLFIFLNILTFVYFITPNPHSVQYYYVHVCSVTRCQVWECGKMWCLSNIIFSIFLIDLVYIFMGRVQQHWLFMLCFTRWTDAGNLPQLVHISISSYVRIGNKKTWFSKNKTTLTWH